MKNLSRRWKIIAAIAIPIVLGFGIIAATGNIIKAGELFTKGFLGPILFTISVNPIASVVFLVILGGAWLVLRRKKRKGGKAVKVIKGLLYIALAINGINVVGWGLVYVMLWGMTYYTEYQRPGSGELRISENIPRQYELRGNEVYMTVAGETKLLVTNAKDVREVTTGPDGYTLQFRPKNGINSLISNCAHPGLTTQVPYGAKKPNTGPWDFETIGSYAQLSGCGYENNASGYLKNSDYFAYIRVVDQKISLVIQDLTTEKETNFNIPKETWDKLLSDLGNDSYETEYGSHYGLADFMGVKGIDGTVYYYPQVDTRGPRGKILLGFSHLVMAIDVPKEKILGIEQLTNPPYSFNDYVYSLQSSNSSPLILVDSGWIANPQAVLDVSGESLKVEPLYDTVETNVTFENFKTPFYEWDSRGVFYLHMYKTVNAMEGHITEKEQAQYDDIGNLTYEQVDKKRTELEKRLQRTGAFIEVRCLNEANIYCRGLVKGTEYRMVPGGRLQEI